MYSDQVYKYDEIEGLSIRVFSTIQTIEFRKNFCCIPRGPFDSSYTCGGNVPEGEKTEAKESDIVDTHSITRM